MLICWVKVCKQCVCLFLIWFDYHYNLSNDDKQKHVKATEVYLFCIFSKKDIIKLMKISTEENLSVSVSVSLSLSLSLSLSVSLCLSLPLSLFLSLSLSVSLCVSLCLSPALCLSVSLPLFLSMYICYIYQTAVCITAYFRLPISELKPWILGTVFY